MKEEDHLESPLLADEEPADRAKGCTYALLASIPTIIYGYNRGVMSGAQKFVQSDLGVTDAQLEVLIGATSVYSLVGSPAAGWACDRAGRRRTIVLSAALFLAGSAVTAAANGYAALMAGQLVAGVACGFGLVVAPVYIAEISPANGRGFLSSFPEKSSVDIQMKRNTMEGRELARPLVMEDHGGSNYLQQVIITPNWFSLLLLFLMKPCLRVPRQIASNSGILLSYIADFALAGLPTPLNWRLMIGIDAIPPLFLVAAAVVVAMPASLFGTRVPETIAAHAHQ